MDLAVIICTHNRSTVVADAFASVVEQHAPRIDLRLILVDNASTDDTADVVASLAADSPVPCVVVTEPTLGLSHARNAGLRQSNDEVVVFLDDDAVADPGWLDAWADVFDAPDVVVGFGPIAPIWDAPRPDWLGDDVASYFTVLDLGLEPHEVSAEEQWFAGANIAFRREALDRVGGFPTNLGRIGSILLSNEEREAVRRISADGGRIRYDPAASVHHHVHADRLQRRWLLRRGFWQGVSNVVARRADEDESTTLGRLHIPTRLVDALIGAGVVAVAITRGIRGRGGEAAPMATAVRYAVRVGERTADYRLRSLATSID